MPSHLGFASFAVAPTALAVSLLAVACGPNTDLIGEGAGSPASAGGQNGGMASVAALVNPSAGTADVPVNLAAVTVRFPVAVTVPDGALTVSGGGQTAAVGVPVIADCPDGGTATCFQMPLSETLMPAATYVVAIGGGVVDGDGRALPAGPVGQFVTAANADLTAPAIIDLAIQPSGPCVLVSFQTDEPGRRDVGDSLRGRRTGRCGRSWRGPVFGGRVHRRVRCRQRRGNPRACPRSGRQRVRIGGGDVDRSRDVVASGDHWRFTPTPPAPSRRKSMWRSGTSGRPLSISGACPSKTRRVRTRFPPERSPPERTR